MASLHEQLQQFKQLEAEAFEAAKKYEEPFDRKIADFEERINQIKKERTIACREAWNRHHVARTKVWETNEKIFKQRYEESKK